MILICYLHADYCVVEMAVLRIDDNREGKHL